MMDALLSKFHCSTKTIYNIQLQITVLLIFPDKIGVDWRKTTSTHNLCWCQLGMPHSCSHTRVIICRSDIRVYGAWKRDLKLVVLFHVDGVDYVKMITTLV